MLSGTLQPNGQVVLPLIKLASFSAITFVAGILQFFPTPISIDHVLKLGL